MLSRERIRSRRSSRFKLQWRWTSARSPFTSKETSLVHFLDYAASTFVFFPAATTLRHLWRSCDGVRQLILTRTYAAVYV